MTSSSPPSYHISTENVSCQDIILEDLLDDENFITQIQVLDFDESQLAEDAILEDNKSDSYKSLIKQAKFLLQTDSLNKLIDYLIKEPVDENQGDTNSNARRYHLVACHVLLSGFPLLESELVRPFTPYMDRFFSYWENEYLLPSSVLRDVYRTLVFWLRTPKMHDAIADQIQKYPQCLSSLFNCCNDLLLATEILTLWLAPVEDKALFSQLHGILVKLEFVKLCVSHFAIDCLLIHVDVAYLLITLLDISDIESQIFSSFSSSSTLNELFTHMLTPNNDSALQLGLQVLNFAIFLVAKFERTPHNCPIKEMSSPLIKRVMKRIPHFFSLLAETPKKTLQLANNSIVIPFGLARLKIIDLIDTLLMLEYTILVDEEFMRHEIFALLLDLLHQYEHNNVVHKAIEMAIMRVLEGSNEEMILSLLQEPTSLHLRILQHHAVDPLVPAEQQLPAKIFSYSHSLTSIQLDCPDEPDSSLEDNQKVNEPQGEIHSENPPNAYTCPSDHDQINDNDSSDGDDNDSDDNGGDGCEDTNNHNNSKEEIDADPNLEEKDEICPEITENLNVESELDESVIVTGDNAKISLPSEPNSVEKLDLSLNKEPTNLNDPPSPSLPSLKKFNHSRKSNTIYYLSLGLKLIELAEYNAAVSQVLNNCQPWVSFVKQLRASMESDCDKITISSIFFTPSDNELSNTNAAECNDYLFNSNDYRDDDEQSPPLDDVSNESDLPTQLSNIDCQVEYQTLPEDNSLELLDNSL